MAAGKNSFPFTVLSLCILFNRYLCSLPVPVLIWTNNRSLQNEKITLGHTLSNKDVVSKYLDPTLQTTPQNMVLFLQDKLSIDDLTKYAAKKVSGKKSVFDNLQNLLDQQIVLPSVIQQESEKTLTELLKEKLNGHVEEVFSTDIDDWKKLPPLNKAESNLLIFHLKPVKGSTEEGKSSILSNNDDIIGRITKHISALGKYTALLTSSEPSEIVENFQNQLRFEEESDHHEYQRHLLTTPSVNGSRYFYNFSNCVYMYATTVDFHIKNETAKLANGTHTVTGGSCFTSNSSIIIEFGKTAGVEKLTLSMYFKTDVAEGWKCSAMKAEYTGTLGGGSLKSQDFNISCDALNAPITTVSYSCGNSTFKSMNGTKTLATLVLGHFQIQPFGVKNDKFSDAIDCAPFFTVPILTGLFVGFILVAILFGGIFSTMGIQAMDRFDDPKGPSIQVPHE